MPFLMLQRRPLFLLVGFQLASDDEVSSHNQNKACNKENIVIPGHTSGYA